jgi:hypothetical protein
MFKKLLRMLTSQSARPPAARAAAPRAPAARAPAQRPAATGRWSAVSLNPGTQGCAAARALGARRHLRADAPRLPLPECTAEHCDCRYRHHADRRGKPRRRSDAFGIPGNFGGAERRARSGGRRAGDA